MTEANTALILGGGGAAGNAWMIGIIAGLAEAGVDLTEIADLVIGTSAGANAAAQLRSGQSPAELLAATLAPPPVAGNQRRPPPPAPMESVFERMRTISAAASSAAELQKAMACLRSRKRSPVRPRGRPATPCARRLAPSHYRLAGASHGHRRRQRPHRRNGAVRPQFRG